MPLDLLWRNATLSELYTIAYHDDAASLRERISAAAEMKRRNRQQLRNELQFKERKVYPR